MDLNIFNLRDEAEEFFNGKIYDIELITNIVNDIEIAINKNKKVSNGFWILLKTHEIPAKMSLKEEFYKPTLERLLGYCIEINEFEMCSRITKIIEDMFFKRFYK